MTCAMSRLPAEVLLYFCAWPSENGPVRSGSCFESAGSRQPSSFKMGLKVQDLKRQPLHENKDHDESWKSTTRECSPFTIFGGTVIMIQYGVPTNCSSLGVGP